MCDCGVTLVRIVPENGTNRTKSLDPYFAGTNRTSVSTCQKTEVRFPKSEKRHFANFWGRDRPVRFWYDSYFFVPSTNWYESYRSVTRHTYRLYPSAVPERPAATSCPLACPSPGYTSLHGRRLHPSHRPAQTNLTHLSEEENDRNRLGRSEPPSV